MASKGGITREGTVNGTWRVSAAGVDTQEKLLSGNSEGKNYLQTVLKCLLFPVNQVKIA